MLLWWISSNIFAPEWRTAAAIMIAAVVTLIGIPAATRIVRQTGDNDPSFVVIDEVAGQMIAMIAVPQRWKSLLVSFILFRAFDIVKPPPLRRLERFPKGSGIMLDDLGAGLYALAIMQALLHFGVLP
jgi:phosphatidylglycerophosphatase A